MEYNATPIIGYGEGLITSDEPPKREWSDRGDMPKGNNALSNDWFTIESTRYNVHPYRKDLGGYPVRWIESVILPEEYRGGDYGDDEEVTK